MAPTGDNLDEEEFYNVKDEAMTLKTQHEGQDGHVIAKINPRDYVTVDKVLETQKKHAIKELGDLKKGMLKAYKNYRAEHKSRARVEKKGPAVIDGMALLPDLSRRVGRRLQKVLEGNQEPLKLGETDDTSVMTVVPANVTALKPLAVRLAITSCAPHRPDWISWIGSSLWAAIWNKYDAEATRVKWTPAPTE